ncbi:GCN5-related N-acetyltransferase [Dictyostelium discoideum AX4]|uniref:GCN5-related N-acetyltransferase n=1 Tax=Dictyostelium discoideum TaxID=44689 RepID=Q54DW0_DICDI|nr:GCN5-related N-acetyltransferase [Dictyostelium discoideum AX4]EAL61359.1 GCN5-related N-acetyltransferase [Dictyostelium discoideum AX4]|eukprot:XP_629762.1 GCN5-related N-acetyltransferase [Dictyostelium discoideum AX4]
MSIIKLINDNSNIKELTKIFNDSFADYVYPLSVTELSLQQKIQGDNVSLDYSIGLYNKETNELEGFILHGVDNLENPKRLYNSATGVIPSARGKSVERCYNSMIPYYIEKGIESIILEVVTTNNRASKVYERCGFKIISTINSYKGLINKDLLKPFLYNHQSGDSGSVEVDEAMNNKINIKKLDCINDDVVEFLSSQNKNYPMMIPTWSNSIKAIKREFDLGFNKCWIATTTENDKVNIIGFLSVNDQTFRIRQLFVSPDYRNKNVATNLIHTMALEFNESTTFNFGIDSKFDNTINFFTKRLGFAYLLSVYEMLLNFENK